MSLEHRSKEQKLIDICFDLVLTYHNFPQSFVGKSQDDVAKWVSEQLRGCGFDTEPVGASWGVLKSDEPAHTESNFFVARRVD
jgi:hypothetical protein